MAKLCYYFGASNCEGRKEMKALLGGKGSNLAEMAYIGIPVPPGFTISTEACELFNANDNKLTEDINKQVTDYIIMLEKETGKKFGDVEDPLLVSVRSGAAVSMPGMMDTVLNLGLNDETIKGVIKKSGNERFCYDSYRRFLQMFGDVVMGVEHHLFEEQLDIAKKNKGVEHDTQLDTEDMKKVVEAFKAVILKAKGRAFPNDVREQLDMSISAVFGSWNNSRAISYRRLNDIRGLKGTAVNVQTMVFGNMGETSGTGVCFTRDPSIGTNYFYGEYLMNAQGEDVVAGIRTPKTLKDLAEANPKVYKELDDIRLKLEKHYKDMQDMEFTIQEGILYLLQTRSGKRTAKAALKVAVDMVAEGLLTEEQAVLRIDPAQLDQLLHKQFIVAEEKKAKKLANGLPASPGAAVGQICFTAAKAFEEAALGKAVILCRTETSPEDIEGMNAAQGILTARGGMTSHAAVVARGMGKCCVAGVSDLNMDEEHGKMTVKSAGLVLKEGEWISLNGSSGNMYEGKISVEDPEIGGDFETLMKWANKFRKMGVRTNADTPKDAALARSFGASGIGLTRTEHMFFEGIRIKVFREMIVAKDLKGRMAALEKLEKIQQEDFEGIFAAMDGLPVTIRLLDPPLHEFLPSAEEDIVELAKIGKMTRLQLEEKIEKMKEMNPMLGHRGCRLSITYPEICEMQASAIIKGALAVTKSGKTVIPEIMIPLVGFKEEYDILEVKVRACADKIIKESGVKLDYKVGTMIEVPRGALRAAEIAEKAEFFSFGTNDLTQMTLGFSRDDAGVFLNDYLKVGVFEKDPFQSIDQVGVGELVKIAAKRGREARPNIHLGVCGEHGGDPASVEFFNTVPLDYVSCSPYRVPIALLAAAQAVLKQK